MSPAIVKPQLVDLYCNTGQPDRALELLSPGASEDASLGQEPGSSFFRQGQVYLLLGNYLSAASLLRERAIPRLRFDRSMRALSVGPDPRPRRSGHSHQRESHLATPDQPSGVLGV